MIFIFFRAQHNRKPGEKFKEYVIKSIGVYACMLELQFSRKFVSYEKKLKSAPAFPIS